MKTLEEIKEEYAISLSTEHESLNWQFLLSGNRVRNMEHHHDAVAKRYAKEVAMQALKNASDHYDECSMAGQVNIKLILNKKNIPEL